MPKNSSKEPLGEEWEQVWSSYKEWVAKKKDGGPALPATGSAASAPQAAIAGGADTGAAGAGAAAEAAKAAAEAEEKKKAAEEKRKAAREAAAEKRKAAEKAAGSGGDPKPPAGRTPEGKAAAKAKALAEREAKARAEAAVSTGDPAKDLKKIATFARAHKLRYTDIKSRAETTLALKLSSKLNQEQTMRPLKEVLNDLLETVDGDSHLSLGMHGDLSLMQKQHGVETHRSVVEKMGDVHNPPKWIHKMDAVESAMATVMALHLACPAEPA